MMSHSKLPLLVLLCGIALNGVGCSSEDSSDSASVSFEIPPVSVGESTTEYVVLNHYGYDWLKLGPFEIDLSDEYRLDWNKINAATGQTIGAPKIAGFYRGRVVFPTTIDLLPGESVVLHLTYTPSDSSAPSGMISFASTGHWQSRFVLDVRPQQ